MKVLAHAPSNDSVGYLYIELRVTRPFSPVPESRRSQFLPRGGTYRAIQKGNTLRHNPGPHSSGTYLSHEPVPRSPCGRIIHIGASIPWICSRKRYYRASSDCHRSE